MAKKKKQPLMGSEYALSQRPNVSPYSTRPVALYVGPDLKEFYVPPNLLQNPKWVDAARSRGDLHLPDVDENTGHVLAHYLYTGDYQTLNDTWGDAVHVEFKRAVSAYIMATAYELVGLQQLATRKIEEYGNSMTIFDVVGAINDDFSRLPHSTTWFHDYLTGKAKSAFDENYTVFSNNGMFDRVNNIALSTALAKCVMDLYNDKVSRMLSIGRSLHAVLRASNPPADGEVDSAGASGEEHNDSDYWKVWLAVCKGIEKKNKKKQKKKEEAEDRRKKQGEVEFQVKDAQDADRRKRAEEEATAVAPPAANDLSWADQVVDDSINDRLGTLASAGKKKKGKKMRAAEPTPLPPPAADPATAFGDIMIDDLANDTQQINMTSGSVDGAESSGFGISGHTNWTSGWGAKPSSWGFGNSSDHPKDKREGKDEDPWSLADNKKKGKTSFDLNFDAFDGAPADQDSTLVVKATPVEDDGRGFGFGSKKKKKGKKIAAIIVEEPEPETAPEPVPVPDPEPMPDLELEPAPEPELGKRKEEDDWGYASFGIPKKYKKEKKSKKLTFEELNEDPIVEEPPPPPPDRAPLIDDDWDSFAAAGKRKGKNAARHNPQAEEPLSAPPEPEQESESEPAKVEEHLSDLLAGLSKAERKGRKTKAEAIEAKRKRREEEAKAFSIQFEEEEPIAPAVVVEVEPKSMEENPWRFWRITTQEKKKGKKGKAEPRFNDPPSPPPETEPEPAPSAEKVEDDGWGGLWGNASLQKSKKGKKRKTGNEWQTIEEPPPPPPEPESLPPVKEKEDDDWGTWGRATTKKGRKGRNAAAFEEPPPPPPEPEPALAAEEKEEDDGWGNWGGTSLQKDKKAKKGKNGKYGNKSSGWGTTEEPPPPPPEPEPAPVPEEAQDEEAANWVSL